MRALVYHGPGQKAWEEVPDPELTDDGDVIVQVDATTICGTDLHILAGDVRVPYADTSTYRIPAGAADEEILMLADILPTGYEVGVHGKAATLHPEEQWARDITITTGQVDGSSTPTLMRLVATGQLDASRFVTHHFPMEEFDKAYNVFGDAGSGALKVVLTR